MPTRREIPFARPMLGDEERAAVSDVLAGHILTHGPKGLEFERRFADRVGVKHAIATSSCTTALHLALVALDIGPGDEVIVPAETHVATAHVVEHCGARPVFVDVEAGTGNIDPALAAVAITPRTRAIMVVHYLALPVNMGAIHELVAPLQIPVIEDCALALGADYGGRHPGSLGLAGAFSFYPTKHMTTLEGGMLTTNDEAFAARVRKQRAFGYSKNLDERTVPGIYDIEQIGYNYRMSEAQAAVGVCQLKRLDGFLQRRAENSAILFERLSRLPEITLFPTVVGPARSSHYCVNIMLKPERAHRRNDMILALKDAGVGVSVHYPVALPHARFYREKYRTDPQAFPVARWISESAISLPCGPHLEADDMEFVAERVVDIVRRNA